MHNRCTHRQGRFVLLVTLQVLLAALQRLEQEVRRMGRGDRLHSAGCLRDSVSRCYPGTWQSLGHQSCHFLSSEPGISCHYILTATSGMNPTTPNFRRGSLVRQLDGHLQVQHILASVQLER